MVVVVVVVVRPLHCDRGRSRSRSCGSVVQPCAAASDGSQQLPPAIARAHACIPGCAGLKTAAEPMEVQTDLTGKALLLACGSSPAGQTSVGGHLSRACAPPFLVLVTVSTAFAADALPVLAVCQGRWGWRRGRARRARVAVRQHGDGDDDNDDEGCNHVTTMMITHVLG